MEEAVSRAAGKGEGGVEDGPHGFSTAGQEAKHASIGVGGKAADGGEDDLGGGGVVERSPDVLEGPGRAGDWVSDTNDDGRFESEAVSASLGNAEQPNAEGLPKGLRWVCNARRQELVVQNVRSLSRGDHDDGIWNDWRSFLGECPKRFGEDSRCRAEDRDKDNAGRRYWSRGTEFNRT